MYKIRNHGYILRTPCMRAKGDRERAATAGDGCMWKEVHGWTDDVISGPQTVIDIAYISSDVYSTGLHGFRKGTP